MTEMASLHAVVYGHVQGVFFRAFVLEKAVGLGLHGYVCNLPSGQVDVYAEGLKNNLESLLEDLKVGPPRATVTEVKTHWSAYSGKHSGFIIKD